MYLKRLKNSTKTIEKIDIRGGLGPPLAYRQAPRSHNRPYPSPAMYGWLCLRFVAFSLAAAHFLAIKEFILWLGGMGDRKAKWALAKWLLTIDKLRFPLLLQGFSYALGYLLPEITPISSLLNLGGIAEIKADLLPKPLSGICKSLDFSRFFGWFAPDFFDFLIKFGRRSVFFRLSAFGINYNRMSSLNSPMIFIFT